MSIPKYHLAKEDLKEQITGGKFKINARFLSAEEIMIKYSVGRVTAYRILNELKTEGYLQIRNGIGTFVRDFSSGIKTPDNNIVFVNVTRNIQNPYFMNIFNGAKSLFSKNDCNLLYEWLNLNPRNNRINRKEFSSLKTKLKWMKKNNKAIGAILTGALFRDTVNEFKETGLPCVIAGDLSEPGVADDLDLVGSDSFALGHDSTSYLIALNHRRIGLLLQPENYSWVTEKLRGYRAAFKEAGCRVDEDLVMKAGSDETNEGYLSVIKLNKLKNKPTAVICCDDSLTIGALKATNELGLKIPADLSVLGLTDLDTIDYYYPGLARIRTSPFKLGQTAMNILLDKISNKTNRKEHKIVNQAEFVKGSSCRKI